jgi:hypothetical protein
MQNSALEIYHLIAEETGLSKNSIEKQGQLVLKATNTQKYKQL